MSPLLLVVIQHQDRLFWCSLWFVGLERGIGTDVFLLGTGASLKSNTGMLLPPYFIS